MTDHDALLAAICASPDDDTPRLIFADFLEENGEAERAAFVRAQVELARTPAWEPFAVLCRTRKREWSEAGEPFRGTLPELPPGLEWHEQPFRRGLGWRMKVGSIHNWNAFAPRLYEHAPVGELDLNPPATRDDWQTFAAGDWVKHFRVIHLSGTSPVEAIRALCENPAACGITDIHFHRASSPGLPELVEDLLATPLGRGLKGLHFYVGYQSVDVLIEALATSLKVALERLTFHTMGLTPERLTRLLEAPIAAGLKELTVENDRLVDEVAWDDEENPFLDRTPVWIERLPDSLEMLQVENTSLQTNEMEAIAGSTTLSNLRLLNLSRNYWLRYSDLFFELPALREVKALVLRQCEFTPKPWRKLVQSPIWGKLVHLDLRGNRVGETATLRLCASPPRPALVSMLLSEPERQSHAREIRERFGEVAVFDSPVSE